MKYITIQILLLTSLFAQSEGENLYASCKFCHGFKAEKMFENRVPALKELSYEVLVFKLKLYKEGKIDEYGYGSIMQQQMKNIPDDKIPLLSQYIKSL